MDTRHPPTAHGARRSFLLAGALLAFGTAAPASAQTAALNWGNSVIVRFEENVRSTSSGPSIPETALVLDALLDTNTPGPYVLTLEQDGRALASGSCRSRETVFSGTLQEGERFLRDCRTDFVDTASIRANQPVDVVLAIVNDATDERIELYRGTFPVLVYWDWSGSYPLERRQLRLDSLYGVGYLREVVEGRVQFMYVTTDRGDESYDGASLRCRVGNGEWVGYELRSTGSGDTVSVRNAPEGNTLQDQVFTTRWVAFDALLPVAVPGRERRPRVGASLDGEWTCEYRTGGIGRSVVQREFRFDVRDGYIARHALEAQVPPGRGVAFASIGFNPGAMPKIIDPAIVRSTVGGRRLAGGLTAPVVAGMPTRASNPTLTGPRRASGGRRR